MVINALDISKPLLKVGDLIRLLMAATQGKLWGHTGLNTVAELVFVEEGVCVTEEGILGLYFDTEIPEGAQSLLHSKQLNVSDFLPVLREKAGFEFYHKLSKCEAEDLISID